jgi:hypothetical protein
MSDEDNMNFYIELMRPLLKRLSFDAGAGDHEPYRQSLINFCENLQQSCDVFLRTRRGQPTEDQVARTARKRGGIFGGRCRETGSVSV